MNEDDRLTQLGASVWEFRKQNGFSESLPVEIQMEAAKLSQAGVTRSMIAKAIGVTKTTVTVWHKKYSDKFREVAVVDERAGGYEITLSGSVQGCRVELVGSDFSLLQRLLKKLGS